MTSSVHWPLRRDLGFATSMELHYLCPPTQQFSTENRILYSETDKLYWHAGWIREITSFSLIFEGRHRLPPGKHVEMTFNAPPDVLGANEQGKAEQVYCTGVIVRTDISNESGKRVARMKTSITRWYQLPAGQGSDE